MNAVAKRWEALVRTRQTKLSRVAVNNLLYVAERLKVPIGREAAEGLALELSVPVRMEDPTWWSAEFATSGAITVAELETAWWRAKLFTAYGS